MKCLLQALCSEGYPRGGNAGGSALSFICSGSSTLQGLRPPTPRVSGLTPSAAEPAFPEGYRAVIPAAIPAALHNGLHYM